MEDNSIFRFWVIMTSQFGLIDIIIFIIGVINFFLLFYTYCEKKKTQRKIEKMPNNPDWAISEHGIINFCYTVFLTIISIFPLLGMFGTVTSLLNLDFTNLSDNLDSVKIDFFRALTSTAWGLFFSIVYKVINAIVFYDIEEVYDDLDSIIKGNKNKKREKRYSRKLEKIVEDDSDEE